MDSSSSSNNVTFQEPAEPTNDSRGSSVRSVSRNQLCVPSSAGSKRRGKSQSPTPPSRHRPMSSYEARRNTSNQLGSRSNQLCIPSSAKSRSNSDLSRPNDLTSDELFPKRYDPVMAELRKDILEEIDRAKSEQENAKKNW